MLQGNYERMLEKIAKASGLEKGEIERRIEAKRAKLSGLITKEGASQILIAELGISFDDDKLKIDELLPGMKKVNVVGKIINLFPVREFVRNNTPGKVVNFVIADDTSNIKVVLWDTNHIELIENGKVANGSVVEILNASMRDNELHLGSFSEFKPSEEKFDNIVSEISVREKKISSFKNMESVKTRAFIVQIFDPRFFEVCPECKRKGARDGDNYNCQTHGKVMPEKRALINLVLDDGTETIRTTLFHEAISGLGLTNLEDAELLAKQKQDLLGKEMVFSGNIRKNKMFENLDFIVDNAKEIEVEELIKELEK